jgi:hypothetical protein
MSTSRITPKHHHHDTSRRYDHAYAIVRLDEFLLPATSLEHCVTVKKIVWNVEEAQREVERLNALQHSGVRYVYTTTRLKRSAANSSNRIVADIPEPRTQTMDFGVNREFLKTIHVPEFIDNATKNGGFGFSGFMVYETCEHASAVHHIEWKGLVASIYVRELSEKHVDVVGIRVDEDRTFATFAFTAFDDLCEFPIGELAPLEIVRRFAERFGLTMYVGSKSGKFFLQEVLPIPTIIVPGTPEGQFINVVNPSKRPYTFGCMLRREPPNLTVALAFCIDTVAYQKWIDSHQNSGL